MNVIRSMAEQAEVVSGREMHAEWAVAKPARQDYATVVSKLNACK